MFRTPRAEPLCVSHGTPRGPTRTGPGWLVGVVPFPAPVGAARWRRVASVLPGPWQSLRTVPRSAEHLQYLSLRAGAFPDPGVVVWPEWGRKTELTGRRLELGPPPRWPVNGRRGSGRCSGTFLTVGQSEPGPGFYVAFPPIDRQVNPTGGSYKPNRALAPDPRWAGKGGGTPGGMRREGGRFSAPGGCG